MSIASMAHVFESGINAAPSNTGGLETLVRRQLDLFAKEREQQAKENAARFIPPAPTPGPVPIAGPVPGPASAQAPTPTPAPAPVPAPVSAPVPVLVSAPTIKSEPLEGPATPATLTPASPEKHEKPEITPAPSARGPSDPRSRSNTIMTETGDYLVQVASTYARLTTNLVSGAHVEMAIMEAHEHSRITSRFTDMSTLVAMDVEQQKLRKIQHLTDKFFREVQETWNPGVVAASPEPAPQQIPSSSQDAKRASFSRVPLPTAEVETPKPTANPKPAPSSQASPEKTSPVADVTMSDDSGDDDEEEQTFAKIDMDALRQRGKGSYYCPLGHRCDKGGVDKTGNLVLFDRNSSFAQHCNKHRKPWRCEVPGCPNPPKKRRFARRDGLERHKATVKHRVGT